MVHTLAWVVDHYVVSLWSDLPETRLQQLAVTTSVITPNPTASQRHIPASWPAPLPLDRLPTRLRAIVSGATTYERHGTKLTIRYLFNIGSYSQGALYGLDKWKDVSVTVVFPPSLQRRTNDPVSQHTFGGGDIGTGGDTTTSMAGMARTVLTQALRQGVTVRLAWREQGHRRQQTFHFPLLPAASCARQDPSCPVPPPGR